ncbi:hypothetical protein [Bathymodiolus platifrons methanotrophic gill symbiont]|uniref:hypothetical protein n=1 Tax=Bathymodiolus platifrons methanotrophic gill symbiont TaxID=113268 RepID=UPI001C8DC282|nr:hypothetical protein [Bathymodiolus platifrons methanotrophic gill symbiont]
MATGVPEFREVAWRACDLAATDEQILDDFKSVLSEYREISKYNPPLKNFTPKKMKEWYEKKLLPSEHLISGNLL